MHQQGQVTQSNFKKIKNICVQIEPIHAVQVLVGLSILVFFAFAVGMLITIDRTLKDNVDLNEDAFEKQIRISRLQLYQLHDLFIFIIVSLTSVMTIWLWNYGIPAKTKLFLLGNNVVGILVISFFLIVSIVSFFLISKKTFAGKPIRVLNTATIFFTLLIFVLYSIVYFYNKYV